MGQLAIVGKHKRHLFRENRSSRFGLKEGACGQHWKRQIWMATAIWMCLRETGVGTTDYQRHIHHSIRMYHGDLDNNGSYDLVESYYEPESEQWVPLRDLIALGNAFPFVRERHRTYAGMSKTHVDELFQGISTLGVWLEINTLETGVFWNDQGRFQWEPLPVEAQQTPAISLAAQWTSMETATPIFSWGRIFSLCSLKYLVLMRGWG